MWIIFVFIAFIVVFYVFNLVYDNQKKKKKLLNLVGKKVEVIIGKSNLPDVRVNGTLHYDNNYSYSNGNKEKKYWYIECRSIDFKNNKKLVVEQYGFSVFELRYIFLLRCNN